MRLILSWTWRHREEVKTQLHLFLISELDGGEWVNFTPHLLYPREGTPVPLEWETVWVGLAAGLDDLERRKISCPFRNSIPGSPSPWRSHYADYDIPAAVECCTCVKLAALSYS